MRAGTVWYFRIIAIALRSQSERFFWTDINVYKTKQTKHEKTTQKRVVCGFSACPQIQWIWTYLVGQRVHRI